MNDTSTPLPVAVDAMGGDRAPAEIVAGARQASEELGLPVLLVGDPDLIGDTGGLPVLACRQVIDMHDDPASSVRIKKDSSLVRAAEAVRDGKACAMVSAGNTGATMASALLRMGRLKGVARPAIATPIPVPGTTPTTIVDAGANAECTPPWLVQFARMGAVYVRHQFGIAEPRIGLLSIGEEPSKGNLLVKETHALLAKGEGGPDVSFVGNVEGRDLMSDMVDVIVTDGFTGNVLLKAAEGILRWSMRTVLSVLDADDEARAAAQVLLPRFIGLAEELDADTYGGAVLLGTRGLCIISHGSSSARAIFNAVRVAHDAVKADLVSLVGASVLR
ncbi:MAG TPA: phosphate acyltransferase PlsX [Acidimicrobiales bacterium]|nr:phosphate acyltransferase PlsX [Acidimicrobiales bacterium]